MGAGKVTRDYCSDLVRIDAECIGAMLWVAGGIVRSIRYVKIKGLLNKQTQRASGREREKYQ